MSLLPPVDEVREGLCLGGIYTDLPLRTIIYSIPVVGDIIKALVHSESEIDSLEMYGLGGIETREYKRQIEWDLIAYSISKIATTVILYSLLATSVYPLTWVPITVLVVGTVALNLKLDLDELEKLELYV